MFNEKSGLVQIWVRLLLNPNSNYTIDNIPQISNLKDEVIKLL